MKKAYSKPEIVFENFSLTTSIAGNCEHIYTFARDICSIPDENGLGMNIFSTGVAGTTCVIDGSPDSKTYDGFCYHIPTETNNLFTS